MAAASSSQELQGSAKPDQSKDLGDSKESDVRLDELKQQLWIATERRMTKELWDAIKQYIATAKIKPNEIMFEVSQRHVNIQFGCLAVQVKCGKHGVTLCELSTPVWLTDTVGRKQFTRDVNGPQHGFYPANILKIIQNNLMKSDPRFWDGGPSAAAFRLDHDKIEEALRNKFKIMCFDSIKHVTSAAEWSLVISGPYALHPLLILLLLLLESCDDDK